jgi:hypothetical protein
MSWPPTRELVYSVLAVTCDLLAPYVDECAEEARFGFEEEPVL